MSGKDKALADAVAELIDALDEDRKLDRCSAPGCWRLAVGEPDIGPSVLEPVCENHVPACEMLIGCQCDITDALRSVLKKLDKYGIKFDLETGRRKK